MVGIFGSNEGFIEAVDEYFGDQEEGFYFEGISKLEQHWRKCFKTREIILRNNGTISVLGHSQSIGAENFFYHPWYMWQSVDPEQVLCSVMFDLGLLEPLHVTFTTEL